MTPYDAYRERTIDTPMGNVEIAERLWNEGEDDEQWAYTQSLNPELGDNAITGEALGHFVKCFAVARQLVEEGYTLYAQIDSEHLLWVRYTKPP